MKTILTSLTLALLLAPALQAGDHKKSAPSSEERRIQDAQKRLDETAHKINAAKRALELLTRQQENNAKSLKQYQTDLANKKAAAEKRARDEAAEKRAREDAAKKRAQEEAAKKRARDEAIKKKAQESDAAKRRQAPVKKPQRPAPSKAEATLASQLAATEKAMAQLREQQNELSEKRSAIYKQLIEVRKREQAARAKKWEAEEAAKKKEREAAAAKWRADQAAKKKEADARAAKYKAEQESKKKQAAAAAAKSRADFLKRFDRNRDGQVTKDETRATLAEEAKRRAAEREKAKQKK
jgi:hypothetical protein